MLTNLTHIFIKKWENVCRFNNKFVSLEHYKKQVQQQLKVIQLWKRELKSL